MRRRLGQVVYTLTQFPTVDGVRFELDGTPTSTFGGEGVTFPPAGRPIVRKDFRDQLPAIFVDRPAWGASIGNPANVSGLANVFEATFRVEPAQRQRRNPHRPAGDGHLRHRLLGHAGRSTIGYTVGEGAVRARCGSTTCRRRTARRRTSPSTRSG